MTDGKNRLRASRRSFLGTGVGAATALLWTRGRATLGAENHESAAVPADAEGKTASPALSTPPDLAPAIRLSLAGYSFREVLDRPGQPGKMSLKELVTYAARLGIDGVEPTSYYFLRTDDAYIYDLKRHAVLLGMDISGTPIRSAFSHPPGAALDEEMAHVRKWVDICVKLGSPVIRIFAGKKRDGVSRQEDLKHAIAHIRTACDYAGSRGIFLAIENHGYLTETADDCLRILEGVDHPWFGMNLDTGNFVGEPYGQIARMAPHAVVCQLKAMVRDSSTGKRVEADHERIFSILKDAGYRGYVALEYEGSNPHESAPPIVKKLQGLLAEC